MNKHYNICVIDIGSPKLGNLGWCFIDAQNNKEFVGHELDELFPIIADTIQNNGLILGLEAPLFVPLRLDLMLATKARKGEGKRPWSAGAGAQVLTMNLPIMVYLFKKLHAVCENVTYFLNEKGFYAKPNEIMLFEAIVSGIDKGNSHIHDAQIMARSCHYYSKNQMLPESLLEYETNVEYFNLAAAALIRSGFEMNLSSLHEHSPIYKPKQIA